MEKNEILLADGSVKEQSQIAVGDLLMGDDGSSRRVLSVFIKENEEILTILPKAGRPFSITGNTPLVLASPDLSENAIISFNAVLADKTDRYDYFCFMHPECIRKFENEIPHSEKFNPYEEAGMLFLKQTEWDRDPFFADPYIAKDMLLRPLEERLEFIAGIIDRSYKFQGADNSYSHTFLAYATAREVMKVASSLGIRGTLKRLKKGGTLLRLCGDLKILPVRKAEISEKPWEYTPGVNARAIKFTIKVKSEIGPYYGFICDGNHRYLSSDFTVFHDDSAE